MIVTELIKLETQTCCVCGVLFSLPEELLRACRNNTKKDFYCPNGHSMVFRKSLLEQDLERVKNERDQAERARQSLHQQLTTKEIEIKKLNASIKRRNKRIAAGVCPCCNRTFKQLAEHIKTKHPELLSTNKVNDIHSKINSK